MRNNCRYESVHTRAGSRYIYLFVCYTQAAAGATATTKPVKEQ